MSEDLTDTFNAEVKRLGFAHGDLVNVAEPLVEYFLSVDPEEREGIRASLSYTAKDALLGCSNRLGTAAVSQSSPELLRQAIATLALVDEGNDFRDSYTALQHLRECARKLGMNPRIFTDAADLLESEQMRRYFIQVARRQPQPTPLY